MARVSNPFKVWLQSVLGAVAFTVCLPALADVKLTLDQFPGGKLMRGKGCDECFRSGYAGRTAIYEVMPIDTHIQEQIVNKATASTLKRGAHRAIARHGKDTRIDFISPDGSVAFYADRLMWELLDEGRIGAGQLGGLVQLGQVSAHVVGNFEVVRFGWLAAAQHGAGVAAEYSQRA